MKSQSVNERRDTPIRFSSTQNSLYFPCRKIHLGCFPTASYSLQNQFNRWQPAFFNKMKLNLGIPLPTMTSVRQITPKAKRNEQKHNRTIQIKRQASHYCKESNIQVKPSNNLKSSLKSLKGKMHKEDNVCFYVPNKIPHQGKNFWNILNSFLYLIYQVDQTIWFSMDRFLKTDRAS